MSTRRVGRQVAGPSQHSRPTARSQWFAAVLSGQAGSYSVTAARRQRHGPPVRHRYRPSDATTPHRTTDRVQGDRRQDQTCTRH
jgi:hypothetical protein